MRDKKTSSFSKSVQRAAFFVSNTLIDLPVDLNEIEIQFIYS